MADAPPTEVASASRTSRGDPAATRQRLLATAAEVFNRDGYAGTDTNRIAREAGYAPATFYKHFKDKREIFLAVYQNLVQAEWGELDEALGRGGPATELADRLVQLVIAQQRRMKVFRRSLRALVASDPEVRTSFQLSRARELEAIARLRATHKTPARTREQDALLLFSMERVNDAVVGDEMGALNLRENELLSLMRGLILAHLS